MKRIQRKRTKGWQMPEGAVYVGRPSRWGNPYSVGECLLCLGSGSAHEGPHDRITVERAVDLFLMESRKYGVDLAPLRGANALACWCRLDQPCHADVLLQLLCPDCEGAGWYAGVEQDPDTGSPIQVQVQCYHGPVIA